MHLVEPGNRFQFDDDEPSDDQIDSLTGNRRRRDT